ncbi:hypothetical protein A0J61_01436 [Choanephora cucurbitarum]|uniref:Uncharacterized protein n=1 Tax=Choanephora cucurbitarum TaxID=101091 RepID=A0A1C7NN39_9FUNG|nr:hypothetical protein A0J61_01436 [Choanephora cucurbitarum]
MSDKENNVPLDSIKKDTKISNKTTLPTESTHTINQDDSEVSVEKARRSAAPGLADTPWHLQEDSVELARPSKTALRETPIQKKSGYINVHHKQLDATAIKSTDQTQQEELLEQEIKKIQKLNADKTKQLLALKDQIKQKRKELDELESTLSQVTVAQDNISRINTEIEEHKEMFVELSGMLKEVDETWSGYQQSIEEKEQCIEERLNQLSTVKYHILELEEQL